MVCADNHAGAAWSAPGKRGACKAKVARAKADAPASTAWVHTKEVPPLLQVPRPPLSPPPFPPAPGEGHRAPHRAAPHRAA